MIRPLTDRVLVKRLVYEHPTLYVAGITLQKGVVMAVGPGKRQRRKVRFDKAIGSVTGSIYFEDGNETGKVYPMPIKVGDIVEFSPRNQIEWTYNGEDYVWIRAGACYGTTNDSPSEAMLWQQSAGHDRNGNFMSGAEEIL